MSQVETHKEISDLLYKFRILDLILESPEWPDRRELSPSGRELFDLIVSEGKDYLLCVVKEDYAKALNIIGSWAELVNIFMDQTYMANSYPSLQMLKCFKYYADLLNIDFNSIKIKDAKKCSPTSGL